MDRDAFFIGYVVCALWSSNDESDETGGEPLDRNYDRDDIASETLAEMRADCDSFVDDNLSDLIASGLSADYAGHDFWLTRNRHGAGFWDRGLGEIGDRLTDAAHAYGGVDLVVGDDGKIYA